MTKEEQLQQVDEQIAALEKEYKEWRENAGASGNMASIYQMVGANLLKEKEFQGRLRELERKRADIQGVSPAVAEYIEHGAGKRTPLEYSKLDVLDGTTTVDDSLLQFHGKEL